MSKVVLVEAVHPQDELAHYISLGYLAAYLLKHKPEVEVRIVRSTGHLGVDLQAGDIVGITSFTQNFNSALRIARDAKALCPEATVVMGGNHVTFLPESMSGDMDCAVIGEGEQALLELVEAFLGRAFDREKASGIDGLVYGQGDEMIRTKPRMPIADLDSIPPPARHLTHTEKHHDRIEMITSRGCPFKCVYCGSTAMWGQCVRFHSVEYVTAEMDEVVARYHPRWLNFVDDLFIAKKSRVAAIMDHIRAKGYDRTMTFYFTGHATMIDDQLCRLLEGVTCRVAMGFESGSDRVLKRIKTGNVSVEKNQQALDILEKYDNISVGCAFMVGLPEETVEDMEQTYQFIVNSSLKSGAVSMVTPFPGTELWDYAMARGKVSARMDWEQMRFNEKGSIRDKIIIDDAVTLDELEHMFHKINAAIYRIYAKHCTVREMFSYARMTPAFLVKSLLTNPGKYFRFAREYLRVKFGRQMHPADHPPVP